jgi:hypothetical protein
MIYLSFVCFKGDDVAGIWTHGFPDVKTVDDLYFVTAVGCKKAYDCNSILVFYFDTDKTGYERLGKFTFENDDVVYTPEKPLETISIEGELK